MRKEASLEVVVEFEDVDSYQIAHHTKLVAYLERARVRLFAAVGLDLRAGPFHMVLYELQVDFKKPAQLLDRLQVAAWVEELSEVKLVLGYRIQGPQGLVCKARTALVFVDPASKGILPVPEEAARRLAPTS
ncbi:MAG TPA: thioesterase family protein [Myxococcota bacterium]|nr:thioesterase family protein [Myxococcota bacterium]HRY92032.1 thioesterase family protein [Myxococcota bacterium]HSA21079.1 thioesterase family protein [Myxococcota bacterium]